MEGPNDCPICCETYNKSQHAKVTCEFGDCQFEACKCCIRRYLLNTTLDPHCMNCKKMWSADYLVNNLNATWMRKEYSEHRNNLLLDKELSKIPDTIPAAEKQLLCEEIEAERESIRKERLKLNEAINSLHKKERQCQRRIHDIKNHKDTKERRTFIMPCQNDNCRGFISNSYKCDLCKMQTCSKCHELIGLEKNGEHVCKEENIKSVEAIRSNTKPCPKCGTRIQKIDGCDQMWCPQDQVAFSWRTGEIDEGHVHNPHYYEYQRRINNGEIQRNPLDNPCNQMCSRNEVRTLYHTIENKIIKIKGVNIKKVNTNPETKEELEMVTYNKILVLLLHWSTNLWWIVQGTFRDRQYRCRHAIRNFETDLTDLRVKYINNRMTKEMYKKQIQRFDKSRAKNQRMVQIYDLLMEVCKEYFNTLVSKNSTGTLKELITGVKNFSINIQNVLEYFNQEMRKISTTHNVSVEQIITSKIENNKFSHPRGVYLCNTKFSKKSLDDPDTVRKDLILNECEKISEIIM